MSLYFPNITNIISIVRYFFRQTFSLLDGNSSIEFEQKFGKKILMKWIIEKQVGFGAGKINLFKTVPQDWVIQVSFFEQFALLLSLKGYKVFGHQVDLFIEKFENLGIDFCKTFVCRLILLGLSLFLIEVSFRALWLSLNPLGATDSFGTNLRAVV